MKSIRFRRFLALTLTIALAGAISLPSGQAKAKEKTAFKDYENVLAAWEKEGTGTVQNADIVAAPSDFGGGASDTGSTYGYRGRAVKLLEDGFVRYEITAEQEGLYELDIDYLAMSEGLNSIRGTLEVNGILPFNEAGRILFHNVWENETEKFETDKKGNHVMPSQKRIDQWQTMTFKDPGGAAEEPYRVKLKKGKNILKFTQKEGAALLGNIRLHSPEEPDGYREYRKSHEGKKKIEKGLKVIEAEYTAYKDSLDISPVSDRSAEAQPHDTQKQLLNTLNIFSPDSTAVWEVEAEVSGLYRLAFKVKQDNRKNGAVSYNILIDGKVPFKEAHGFRFPETDGYEDIEFAGDKPYEIYLEKGVHTIGLQADGTIYEDLMGELKQLSKEANDLGLNIKKLVGIGGDRYRDWELTKYNPGLKKQLESMADRLLKALKKETDAGRGEKTMEEFQRLYMVADSLRTLAEEPDELANRLGQLSEGSGSVTQSLNDTIDDLKYQPLVADQIYLYGSSDRLPEFEGGFFEGLLESGKRFLNSFKSDDEEEEGDGPLLNVWVNRNQSMADLMQKFADEKFTKETGIRVKFSLIPNEQKLILANTSKEQPDIAMGISTNLPYEFAIRHAAMDLSQFDDFGEVSRRFSPGAFLSYVNDDGVYALPETQDFYVLFYRKDIMEKLKLPIPDTWDDVKELIPELQRYGMNFYVPLASVSGTKPFMYTAPFIYQQGGDIYDTKTMNTALDGEKAVEGIKLMSDLFTVYGLPQQVPSFYNHFRYGTIPIGVSNMAEYQKLLAAAPEIAGSWDIALQPGVKQADGSIDRSAPGSAQAAMAFEGSEHKEECWEFLKWWTSEEVQSEFAFQLQNIYGSDYLWSSANLEAFGELPIESSHKQVILKQWDYMREVPKVPGGYMVEREISNIWNKIVFDGENPRAAVDASLITINKELDRKLEEFKYKKDGKLIRPFKIPDLKEIEGWGE